MNYFFQCSTSFVFYWYILSLHFPSWKLGICRIYDIKLLIAHSCSITTDFQYCCWGLLPWVEMSQAPGVRGMLTCITSGVVWVSFTLCYTMEEGKDPPPWLYTAFICFHLFILVVKPRTLRKAILITIQAKNPLREGKEGSFSFICGRKTPENYSKGKPTQSFRGWKPNPYTCSGPVWIWTGVL